MCCGLNHLVALYSVVPDSLGVYVQETKTSIRHLYILSLHLQYDYCLDPKISMRICSHTSMCLNFIIPCLWLGDELLLLNTRPVASYHHSPFLLKLMRGSLFPN